MRKIYISGAVYAALENKAAMRGLTPDELAAEIVLNRARR